MIVFLPVGLHNRCISTSTWCPLSYNKAGATEHLGVSFSGPLRYHNPPGHSPQPIPQIQSDCPVEHPSLRWMGQPRKTGNEVKVIPASLQLYSLKFWVGTKTKNDYNGETNARSDGEKEEEMLRLLARKGCGGIRKLELRIHMCTCAHPKLSHHTSQAPFLFGIFSRVLGLPWWLRR